jgi:hypothetical protein
VIRAIRCRTIPYARVMREIDPYECCYLSGERTGEDVSAVIIDDVDAGRINAKLPWAELKDFSSHCLTLFVTMALRALGGDGAFIRCCTGTVRSDHRSTTGRPRCDARHASATSMSS